MRVYALSDIHVDYPVNAHWVRQLSKFDYQDDILILAGDVSDSTDRLQSTMTEFCSRFRAVMFVPGNHELWVLRDQPQRSSWEKFHEVCAIASRCGAHTGLYRLDGVCIVPLFSWYDYSFGPPSEQLTNVWMDYRACRWPEQRNALDITQQFLELNEQWIAPREEYVISFSHFLPRLDVMPNYVSPAHHYLYPVLGSQQLDLQVRRLGARTHVYGHSHVNRRVVLDGVCYINNAFGYPRETRIAAKRLLRIHDTSSP